MIDRDEQVKQTEDLLRVYKVLKKGKTLYDFLEQSLDEIYSSLKKVCNSQREYLKPIPDVQSDRLFFYIAWLITLSDSLFTINEKSENQTVKAQADNIRKEINNMIITEVNPYFLTLFRWDLDRRTWKYETDKLTFLKKTILDIEEELKGKRDNLVKKYISLLLDYFINQMDKILFYVKEKDFEQLKLKKEDAFKTRNQLKKFFDSNQLNELIDSDIETSALNTYKPIAQALLEGIIKSTERYDYLIAAFVEAQNDYKMIVSGILNSITQEEVNDIKESLRSENIEQFISILHSIFATVPNQLFKSTSEAHYHMNVHLILQAVGCEVVSEPSVNLGRIDTVVELENLIYIIEYKLSDSTSALNQIKDRGYFHGYVRKKKRIILLGISFDTKLRNIRKQYEMETIS